MQFTALKRQKPPIKVAFARCENTVAGNTGAICGAARNKGSVPHLVFPATLTYQRVVKTHVSRGAETGLPVRKRLFRVPGGPRSFPVVILLERIKQTNPNREGETEYGRKDRKGVELCAI